jgi:hypothetical protein
VLPRRLVTEAAPVSPEIKVGACPVQVVVVVVYPLLLPLLAMLMLALLEVQVPALIVHQVPDADALTCSAL